MPAKQSPTAETPIETQPKNQQQQRLVIGRIVHFVAADGSERAAIVTRVVRSTGGSDGEQIPGGLCDLAVFTTAEEHGSQGAVYGFGKATYDAGGTSANTWHWPAEGTPHPEQVSQLSTATSSWSTPTSTSTENPGAAGAS